MKTSNQILNEYREKTGWNDCTTMLVLCHFIDNNKMNKKLDKYLEEIAKEEDDLTQ